MDKKTEQKLLALVKKNYNEIADEFHHSRQKALWPPIKALVQAVPAGAWVLDAGCGNGRLALEFAGKNINYFGFDSSSRLINWAKKTYAGGNCRFAVGDLLALQQLKEIKQISFDFIFCLAVLHHLPGKNWRRQALAQLQEKLKPNGQIIISVWNLWAQAGKRRLILKFSWQKLIGQNPYDWGDIVFGWGKGKTSQRYYHAFTARELKQLAGQTGLKIKKLFKDKYNYYLILQNQ